MRTRSISMGWNRDSKAPEVTTSVGGVVEVGGSTLSERCGLKPPDTEAGGSPLEGTATAGAPAD